MRPVWAERRAASRMRTTVKAYSPFAITGRMRLHDYAPRPAQLKWLLDSDPAIRWQVIGTSPVKPPTRLQPSGLASQPKAGEPNFSPANLLPVTGAGAAGGETIWRRRTELAITLYSLVVLKDLGLDPASKQARKMIDRVDKGLVFKPLNNRPFLHGETEPASTAESSASARISKNRTTHWPINSWASSSKMAAGTAKHPKAGALRSIPPSVCSKDCSNTNEQGANRRPSPRPARGPKTICSIAICSARFEPAKSSTNAGSASRSQCFGTTTSCADSIICGMQESSPTAVSATPSKP